LEGEKEKEIERIIGYERTTHSSNLKVLKIVYNMEVTFYVDLTPGIGFEGIKVVSSRSLEMT
jgi:hypothetical protein